MNGEVARLGDVAQWIRGITFKPTDVVGPGTPGAVQVMRTKNVQWQLDRQDVWFIDSSHVKRQEQFLRRGDILVSSANSWNLVGKCCWVPELPTRTSLGGFIAALRSEPTKIDPRYLYRWFSSPRIQSTVRSLGNKTTNISNLDFRRCLELRIPLPTLGEQRRIAAVLDQADALRAKRREALSHLDDLTQSIFLNLFTGAASHEWPIVTVEAVAAPDKGSIRTGPFGSQLLHSEFVDSGVAVLGIDNAVADEFRWSQRRFITKAKFRQLSRYRVQAGDVLITIMGTCGRCAVVPDDIPTAINTKHLCCITTDRSICLPEFLHASFLSQPQSRAYLERTAKGAIMAGLNMAIIKAMPMVLPPIDVQREFVRRLAAIGGVRTNVEQSADAGDALFTSLQSRAFEGKL